MGIAEGKEMALVPISDAMPELRGDAYAKVREWDAMRMALEGQYDQADGEYLIKIRGVLTDPQQGGRHGLWKAYYTARGLSETTVNYRIRRAEGRPYPRYVKTSTDEVLPEPMPKPTADWAVTVSAYDEEPALEMWAEVGDDELDQQPPAYAAPTPPIAESVPSVTTYSVEAWNAIPAEARLSVIEEGRDGHAGLNEQKSDSIEWALWSWNPITGCLHECPYCYARDIANRFYPQGFKPTFHPFRLGAPYHQKVPAQAETELGYRNIFTCSMADLFGKWVPADWIQSVLDVVRDNPQWNFLFLTKFPNRLAEFEYPDNAWLGTSVDCQARVKNAERSFARVKGGIKWLSVEPMLEPLHFSSLEMFDWVVIGGASASSQTPAWSPPRRWVDELEAAARAAGCMIYEKTNLNARLREYPGWERAEARLPHALAYLPSIGQEE